MIGSILKVMSLQKLEECQSRLIWLLLAFFILLFKILSMQCFHHFRIDNEDLTFLLIIQLDLNVLFKIVAFLLLFNFFLLHSLESINYNFFKTFNSLKNSLHVRNAFKLIRRFYITIHLLLNLFAPLKALTPKNLSLITNQLLTFHYLVWKLCYIFFNIDNCFIFF